MSSYVTQRASDKVTVLNEIAPLAGARVVESGWINIADFCNLLFKITCGVIETTVDAKIQQATDNAGADKKDVADHAISQLLAADTDKSALINVTQDDTDFNNGFHFVNVELTVVGATSVAGAEALGLNPGYEPAAQGSTIAEVVL